ncbi:hypothetical protein V9T40_008750 [Parthenolecanium corni]|uniref:Uncharacterized protein n=1 Tax=Parthenolecanium corni TaxID=536013 RepID=A0AAN9Y7H0_9HEMI
MQKHSERVRRPSPEHLEPIESTSMVKRKKEVSTIVKVEFESIKVPEIFRRAVSAPNVGYNIDFVTQHFRYGAGVENYAHEGEAVDVLICWNDLEKWM